MKIAKYLMVLIFLGCLQDPEETEKSSGNCKPASVIGLWEVVLQPPTTAGYSDFCSRTDLFSAVHCNSETDTLSIDGGSDFVVNRYKTEKYTGTIADSFYNANSDEYKIKTLIYDSDPIIKRFCSSSEFYTLCTKGIEATGDSPSHKTQSQEFFPPFSADKMTTDSIYIKSFPTSTTWVNNDLAPSENYSLTGYTWEVKKDTLIFYSKAYFDFKVKYKKIQNPDWYKNQTEIQSNLENSFFCSE